MKHYLKLIIPRIKWKMDYLKKRKQFASNKNLFNDLTKLRQQTEEWYNQNYRVNPNSKDTGYREGQLDILNRIINGR